MTVTSKMTALAVLIASFSALGCASPYREEGGRNWQRAEFVGERVLVVTGYASGERREGLLIDLARLKAADEAIKAGFRYLIEDERELPKQITTEDIAKDARGMAKSLRSSGALYSYAADTPIITDARYRFTFLAYEAIPSGLDESAFLDVYVIYNELGPRYVRDFEPRTP